MIQTELVPHASCPPAHDWRLAVGVARLGTTLELHYRLAGDPNQLVLPETAGGARRDNLWQHSCFEAFVQRPDQPGYIEYNFAPNGDWAEYRFSGYRQALPGTAVETPSIHLNRSRDELLLRASVVLPDEQACWLGLTAVLEDRQGALSYWALHHPSEKPDFHHADSFILSLDAG